MGSWLGLLVLAGAWLAHSASPELRTSRRVFGTNGICRFGNRMECCWGWTRESWGECRPVCELGCKHGDCVGPDQCRCHPGYTGKTCNQDVNECGLKPRPCKHRCMNMVGSYKCYCLNGYMMMGDGTCRNARTCAMANCQYGCAVMKGEITCQCPSPGLRLGPDRRTCVDIDECVMGEARCPRFRKCVNTFGSYICKCHKGFELHYVNGKYQCTDKNDQSWVCHDKPGSKKCKCKPGSYGRGYDCKPLIKVTIEPARPATTAQSTTQVITTRVTTTTTLPGTTTTIKRPTTTTTTISPTTAPTTVLTTVSTTIPSVATTTIPTTLTMTMTPATVATTTIPTTVVMTTIPTTAIMTTIPNTVSTMIPTSVVMTTVPTTLATETMPTSIPETPVPTGWELLTTPTSKPTTTTAAATTIASTAVTTAATTTIIPTTPAFPPSPPKEAPTTTPLITSTLDNHIQKEITQRPRGDVHIPKNRGENSVFDLDFDIELGNMAEFARDDPVAGSLTCSFDQGLCSWMNDHEGDVQWQTVNDPEGGRYLTVAETMIGRRFKGARLTIPFTPPTAAPWQGGDLCLAFRYRLHGHHIGSLQLFVRKGQSHSPAVWTRTGGHGWRHTQITLWGQGLKSVVLKGDRKRGRSGEIAVDDFSLRRGACSDGS